MSLSLHPIKLSETNECDCLEFLADKTEQEYEQSFNMWLKSVGFVHTDYHPAFSGFRAHQYFPDLDEAGIHWLRSLLDENKVLSHGSFHVIYTVEGSFVQKWLEFLRWHKISIFFWY